LTPSFSDLVKLVNLDNNEVHYASGGKGPSGHGAPPDVGASKPELPAQAEMGLGGDADRKREAVIKALRTIGPFSLDYAENVAAKELGGRALGRAWVEWARGEGKIAQDHEGYWRVLILDDPQRAEACSLCGRPIADGLSNASYLDGRPVHLLCPTGCPVDPAQAPEVALGALRALGGPFDRIKGLLALGRALGGLQAAEVWWWRLMRDGLLAEIPGGLWALTR
jgi:hypothetical protein